MNCQGLDIAPIDEAGQTYSVVEIEDGLSLFNACRRNADADAIGRTDAARVPPAVLCSLYSTILRFFGKSRWWLKRSTVLLLRCAQSASNTRLGSRVGQASESYRRSQWTDVIS